MAHNLPNAFLYLSLKQPSSLTLVHVASNIGKFQHTKYIKPLLLNILNLAISPVLSDQVTYTVRYITGTVIGSTTVTIARYQ